MDLVLFQGCGIILRVRSGPGGCSRPASVLVVFPVIVVLIVDVVATVLNIAVVIVLVTIPVSTQHIEGAPTAVASSSRVDSGW